MLIWLQLVLVCLLTPTTWLRQTVTVSDAYVFPPCLTDRNLLTQRNNIKRRYPSTIATSTISVEDYRAQRQQQDESTSLPLVIASSVEEEQPPSQPQEIITQEPKKAIVQEVMAGIVAALATLPTSISYASAVGIAPALGIWNSAILGMSGSIVGGSPGLIMGSAGVVALPMTKIFRSHGAQAMAVSLLLASGLQMMFSVWSSRQPPSEELIKEPVMLGFMNALGIFIAKNQLSAFRPSRLVGVSSLALASSMSVAIGTMLMILSLNRFPLIASIVPPPLLSIIVVTCLSQGLRLPLRTLSSLASTSSASSTIAVGIQSIPKVLHFDKMAWTKEKTMAIISTALATAVVSIIATIVTQTRVREHHEERAKIIPVRELKQDNNRAIMAMGIGNVISACIGGFGGCGLIPNTMLNLKNGGISSISTFSYSITMAMFVLMLSPLLNSIPMAALNGLMLLVAWNVIEWNRSKQLILQSYQSEQAKFDLAAMLVTTAISYKVDMGLGIIIGVLIARIPRFVESFRKKFIMKE